MYGSIFRFDGQASTFVPYEAGVLGALPGMVGLIQAAEAIKISAFDKTLKKTTSDSIHAGDFVYCRSKHYRDSLQLPRELGLVLEIKRSNFKVLYASDKRAWLPLEYIAKMKPEMDYTTFLEKLYFLIKKVHAQEVELVSERGHHLLSLQIDEIGHETIEELQKFLGKSFVSINIVPEGMAFMRAEIRFKD